MEAPSGERLRGKRQAWCLLQVKLCDPCLSALKWFVYQSTIILILPEIAIKSFTPKLIFGVKWSNHPNHVLHRLLPQTKNTGYNLRQRTHDLTLPTDISDTMKRTLYIECCSEISINLVFMSHCYFASFYSIADVFYNQFYFLCYISFYVACAFVICLIKYLLTYLLRPIFLVDFWLLVWVVTSDVCLVPVFAHPRSSVQSTRWCFNPQTHRRRSDWNSEGTHGGTYYKSPAVEAKTHIFLHCNASNLVFKILQHDKIWGTIPPAPNSALSVCNLLRSHPKQTITVLTCS